MNTLVWLMVTLVTMASMFGCGRNGLSANDPSDNQLLKSTQNTPQSNSAAKVVLKSVDFYTWWWSEAQLEAGVHRGVSPPKNTYIRLASWQNIGDASIPHPDYIDVVCKVENRGEHPSDFVLSAVGDFKVDSYERVLSNEDSNLNELLKDVPWTEEKKIGETLIRNLTPGEIREVKIENFNLGAVLSTYSDDKNGDLWPWYLRVRVTVESRTGVRTAQGEAVLELLPAA